MSIEGSVNTIRNLAILEFVTGLAILLIIAMLWDLMKGLNRSLRALVDTLKLMQARLDRNEDTINIISGETSETDLNAKLAKNGVAELTSQLAHVFGKVTEMHEKVNSLHNRYGK